MNLLACALICSYLCFLFCAQPLVCSAWIVLARAVTFIGSPPFHFDPNPLFKPFLALSNPILPLPIALNCTIFYRQPTGRSWT